MDLREPDELIPTQPGVWEFVQYYIEKMRQDFGLPELTWDLIQFEFAEIRLTSDIYREPVRVPLRMRRADYTFHDIDTIKARFDAAFAAAGATLRNRMGAE